MHLPVYMWTLDCRKRSTNLFWELLDLVSQCDGETIGNLKMLKVNYQNLETYKIEILFH